jgi:hypothetical protein
MRRSRRLLTAAGLLVVGLQLSACTQETAEADSGLAEPAKVEQVEGSEVSRLTLTTKAAERLGIQTKPVLAGTVAGKQRSVIPYGAILYDANGDTWVYVSSEPLTYVRERVTVDYIEGDQAVLGDGPPEGSAVVTVGAAELYGTETGVGH